MGVVICHQRSSAPYRNKKRKNLRSLTMISTSLSHLKKDKKINEKFKGSYCCILKNYLISFSNVLVLVLRRSLDFVGRLKFYKPSLSDSPPTLPLKGRRWGPTQPPLGRKKCWYISQTWTIYITLLWILLRFSFSLSLYNRSGTEKSFYVSPITREISGTFRSCLLSWKYM